MSSSLVTVYHVTQEAQALLTFCERPTPFPKNRRVDDLVLDVVIGDGGADPNVLYPPSYPQPGDVIHFPHGETQEEEAPDLPDDGE